MDPTGLVMIRAHYTKMYEEVAKLARILFENFSCVGGAHHVASSSAVQSC